MQKVKKIPVLIDISEDDDLSGPYSIDGEIIGFQMPAAWTAASLTFQVATLEVDTGTNAGKELRGTFVDLYDDAGTELSVTVAVDRFVALVGNKADALRRVGAIKIRSGTAATPVAQLADRTINVLVWRH